MLELLERVIGAISMNYVLISLALVAVFFMIVGAAILNSCMEDHD